MIKFDRTFSVSRKFRYNITINKNGRTFSKTTNKPLSDFTIPNNFENDIKKIRVNGYECVECRCSIAATEICLYENIPQSNSIVLVLGIVVGILLIVACVIVVVCMRRQRNKTDRVKPISDEDETFDGDRIEPVISVEYADIPNKPHAYHQTGNSLTVRYTEIPEVNIKDISETVQPIPHVEYSEIPDIPHPYYHLRT